MAGINCEILFRGKDNNIKGFDWVYGYYVKCKSPLGGTNHMIYSGDIEYDWTKESYFPTEAVKNYVDPGTVGRYTGLTDKNGKKIFEGDIIKGIGVGAKTDCFVIRWSDAICGFTAGEGKRVWPNLNQATVNGYEVIGNIHDNPELLEVQG